MRSEAVKGSGKFQWNAGAWFGALLGGTVWIFGIAVSVYYFEHLWACVFIALLGLLSIIAGITMWANRYRISPYSAIQILISILFAVTVAILVLMDVLDIPFVYKFGNNQSQAPGFSPYWLLFIFPAVMAVFIYRNGAQAVS
jgi:hypothetical protein